MPLTVAKAAVTGAALASTAAQGMLGRRLAERQHAADSGNVDAKEQVDRLRLPGPGAGNAHASPHRHVGDTRVSRGRVAAGGRDPRGDRGLHLPAEPGT